MEKAVKVNTHISGNLLLNRNDGQNRCDKAEGTGAGKCAVGSTQSQCAQKRADNADRGNTEKSPVVNAAVIQWFTARKKRFDHDFPVSGLLDIHFGQLADDEVKDGKNLSSYEKSSNASR
jgi:hypothetical protein